MTTTTTPAAEVTVTKTPDEVVSLHQQNACLEIIAQVKRLTGRMLKDYWSVGKLIEGIIADQENEEGALKYGKNAIKYVADGTKHSVAELYRMNTVFKRYNLEQVEQLTETGIGITNVVEAARIVDEKQRMDLLLNAAAKETTVKEFKQEVAAIAESKANVKALESERGEGKKGGGSRTGTGRSGSPITPVKQVGSLGEKIAEAFKNALIGLKEFEPETSKQGENMVEAAETAAGVLSDVLDNAVGFAEVVEEYLAVNQGDGRRRRGQGNRKDRYEAVLTSLQGFVKGYDKTLAGAEKIRKQMDTDEAEARNKAKADKEAAKDAIRSKAEKKATAKPTASAPQKTVPAAISDRLAAMRARALKSKR